MNLVDCWVTEVLGEPYYKNGLWIQEVNAVSHGVVSKHTFYNEDKDNLSGIKKGFKFLA